MQLRRFVKNAARNRGLLRDAVRVVNPRVLRDLAGPAVRGLILQQGRAGDTHDVPAGHTAHFDWKYTGNQPELTKLYSTAKLSQWNGETDLDWSIPVDPFDKENELLKESLLPLMEIPAYRRLPERMRCSQRQALLSWFLSQFLHGEQAALFAACQVIQAVRWTDAKLYGSTQVVDEARHVEVFHRYLTDKLEREYPIDDNLFVVVDALLRDTRWDFKFLGMQIMVEGLALGGFSIVRSASKEPLLRELLRRVITDEARHVHFGVVALAPYYRNELSSVELREREDWAFEMVVFLRNRFLAHEFYDEYYGHVMSRSSWDRLLAGSELMRRFRRMMFKRMIPNLRRINLMSDRIRAHYDEIGLLVWEHGKAAPELTVDELLEEESDRSES